MSASTLLSALSGVKKKGPHSWAARCPAHDDSTPSLSITDSDGTILVHCFGGCEVADICAAVGVPLTELFPPRTDTFRPALRWPWIPEQVCETMLADARLVAIIGCQMHAGRTVSEEDYESLLRATERLQAMAWASYATVEREYKRKKK